MGGVRVVEYAHPDDCNCDGCVVGFLLDEYAAVADALDSLDTEGPQGAEKDG